jgi:hypothetical protein
MWKNIVQRDRLQVKIQDGTCVLHAHLPRATDTHSQYVILIVFPLQLWLHAGLYVTIYVHCVSCLLSVMA